MNFLPVTAKGDQLVLPGNKTVASHHPQRSSARTLGVRPEHLVLATPETAHLSGTLSVIEQFGEYALAYVELPDGELLTVKLDGAPELELHQPLYVGLPADQVHLFDEAGRALR